MAAVRRERCSRHGVGRGRRGPHVDGAPSSYIYIYIYIGAHRSWQRFVESAAAVMGWAAPGTDLASMVSPPKDVLSVDLQDNRRTKNVLSSDLQDNRRTEDVLSVDLQDNRSTRDVHRSWQRFVESAAAVMGWPAADLASMVRPPTG